MLLYILKVEVMADIATGDDVNDNSEMMKGEIMIDYDDN